MYCNVCRLDLDTLMLSRARPPITAYRDENSWRRTTNRRANAFYSPHPSLPSLLALGSYRQARITGDEELNYGQDWLQKWWENCGDNGMGYTKERGAINGANEKESYGQHSFFPLDFRWGCTSFGIRKGTCQKGPNVNTALLLFYLSN